LATFLPSVGHWYNGLSEDLQPTPGRLASSVRVVVAVVLALILLLVLQVPFVNLSLYIIFVVGRESPTISLRSALLTVIITCVAVFVEMGVVIVTDNDPMTRLISVAAITFVAGVLTQASSFAPLAPTLGFLYCTVIALWESQIPPDTIVKASLYLIASEGLALGSAVFVEYLFASRSAVDLLQEQSAIRYGTLETMFRAYARGAPPDELFAAYLPVARLALAGQRGMQELYQVIVQRNLDPKGLPIATRTRLTLLAELVDVSAAFGSARLPAEDLRLRERCAWIADRCREQRESLHPQEDSPRIEQPEIAALRPVEGTLDAIMAMPVYSRDSGDEKLTVLPASKIPFFIPGALNAESTFAFGLKISFCATLCYILYHALDYPEISTAVTTVLVSGLTTTGAMKQKLAHRLAGAIVGGLILGLGSIVFLFPHMDSITALSGLVAAVTFIAAWSAAGRRFGYIGLQIAFSFFTVTLATSKAPTELAPARDRLVGIGLALVIMWFVFDQVWPVRTVTMMRQALASVLRDEAKLFSLRRSDAGREDRLRRVDGLRNQVGKNIVELRTLKDAVLYEFGVDHERQKVAAETIFQAAMVSSALFWNELTVLERKQDQDLAGHPSLDAVRAHLANGLDAMAEAVDSRFPLAPLQDPLQDVSTLQPDARESVYAETLMSRYRDLHSLLTTFIRMFDHPIGSRIDIASPPFLQQKPSDVSLREDERNHYERS
jgi:multidrug resistance protein MdtO